MEPGTALIVGYVVGTLATVFLFRGQFIQTGIEKCLDVLIEKKMVRWRCDVNGQIDILPLHEEFSNEEGQEENKNQPGC